jgi:1A family penicillin-binding protein
MPIPQLSKPGRSDQSWRVQKRKYYISRSKKPVYSSYSHGAKKQKNGDGFFAFLKNKKLYKPLGIAFLVFILVILLGLGWISKDLPDPNKLIDRQIAQSTTIYDRTGENILYEIHGDEQRTLVNLDQIPDYVRWATISIEDKNFYKHGGFSFLAILRTVATNILTGKKAGASTLTQQFVKNAVLSPEKTYTRKIKELILAYKIEQKFSKDEILQMYLNEIPYGSTAYGIEAASQKYFGKSVKNINLAEAAVLAALPQAPSKYSPYGSNIDLLMERQRYILDQMFKQGYISEAKAEAGKLTKVEFKKQTDNITAPHFVMYIKEILSEKYGENMIEQDGLKIYTTLDLYKQKIAEETITETAEQNETKYNATNASLISIDPKTGQILAMVGSRDYFNDEIDGQVNITTSKRQPGSSIKPLVYAALFQKGYTPNTILYDVVTNFSTDPAKPYEPHNYDLGERGPITIRKALAGSLNIPAVKAIYLAGINNVLNLANELGYTTLKDKDRFGLSLVLGGGEVKLLEHANAFSAFAREGTMSPLTSILKVEDKNGKILEEYKDRSKKVLETKIAKMINSVLSDNEARSYVFGAENWLTLGSRPVAAKTGTTNDYKDAWTIGYTPSIVTGVWVGNSNNKEMKKGADGSVVAAPIWNKYMKKVLGDTPIESFNSLGDVKTGKAIIDGETNIGNSIKIDKASGFLATEYTPASFIEEKNFSQAHSILYYVDKNNPLGDAPKNPSSDPQFNLWESRVLVWAEKKGLASSTPPTEYDNLHTPENQPIFEILSPNNQSTITTPALHAEISGSSPRGINRVDYYINNNLFSTSRISPFNFNESVSFLNNGFHNLKIVVCDDIDNCSEKSIEFNLSLPQNQPKGNIKISWLTFKDGLALNKNDFPLSLDYSLSNFSQIANITVYYKNKAEEKFKPLNAIQQINSNEASLVWEQIPASGTYSIYAEATGWSGQIEKTKELNFTITN